MPRPRRQLVAAVVEVAEDDWVIGALTEDLGRSAWYQPLSDICSTQRKIACGASASRPPSHRGNKSSKR